MATVFLKCWAKKLYIIFRGFSKIFSELLDSNYVKLLVSIESLNTHIFFYKKPSKGPSSTSFNVSVSIRMSVCSFKLNM